MKLDSPQAVIVDDNPFFREIFSTCLRSLGWNYGVMSSGYELVEYFLHNGDPYDIAIIESDLPFLNGIETAESVNLFIPSQNIIFTGKEKPENLPEGSLFMPKPVDFTVFVRYLQSVADKRMAGNWVRPEAGDVLIKAAG